MQKFNVGDTVVLKTAEQRDRKHFGAEAGAKGKIVGFDGPYIRIEWDRADGLAHGQMDGGYRRADFDLHIEPKPQPKKRKSRPKEANTKIAKLRAHFLSGRSLTQLEAIGLYGAYRLAARVHDLKAEGFKFDTVIKEDPMGNPYAEYKLRSRRV
ncbi:helix-turn-helix domain-containing protein [Brucella sp. 10RB9213]|uniref:helix-turn-helix domain-containing protein n=1 Tax=Brucella sp. 10RB9213 TaxID=1844039 RepID=UPI0018A05698|nr:helix-turn-helix domain-containing protein [Brucella sp. 10RB9213]